MPTMMKTDVQLLARYKNGNYVVRLYSNGTKIKRTKDDDFVAEFPDSIDLKITDYCDLNCPMCHESSSKYGKHCNLNAAFLDTLHAGTELAIGGGNPLSHPHLTEFLQRMKAQNVICNLTVNEKHFLQNRKHLEYLLAQKLIWGFGVSINECSDEALTFASQNGNIVLHAICGVIDDCVLQKLYNKNLKILFLGYKNFGRGKLCYSTKIEDNILWLKDIICNIAPKFNTICFDNLAIKQLKLDEQIPKDLFEKRYMGDDGTASMYIDLVNELFAESSTSTLRYPIKATIKEMFEQIKH